MKRTLVGLLVWYFAVFHYGARVVGPFRTEDLCKGARTWALQQYFPKQVSPCWSDGR